MTRRPFIRRPAVLCAGVVAVALAAAAVAPMSALAAGSRAAAPAPSTTINHITVVATSSDAHGDALTINNSVTSGKPNALLFVTPNFAIGGNCGCVYDDGPIAVYYTGAKWQIINTGGLKMKLGTEFNVLVVSAPSANAFVLHVTSANIAASSAYINSSSTNAKTTVKLQVTQVSDGLFDNNTVGVWYDPSRTEWAVFNESGNPMQTGLSFNILAGPVSGGGKVAVHRSNSANTGFNYTTINLTLINGNASAFVLETPLFNLDGGATGVDDEDATGVWYDGSQWTVFQEDNTAGSMPLGASFNLLLFS